MAADRTTPEFAAQTQEATHQAAPNEIVGCSIGPYKLLQRLGEGGMGVVWVAEQTAPVKRRVALKAIKPGMDSELVLRRFEAERQALALMDHTNIAKVLDAGTTARGQAYFVMELVHGVPITRYCDELHLPIHERLELFVPVCQAIQHAHQKGIIHRDIKPTNVLVCIQDGKPVPKVIDFGVAKALHQRLTETTMYTEMGTVIGTLEYMSPEQAEMSPLGVDTRSDVYSLGVLLYELSTGTTPFDRKRLRTAAYTEMVRIIKDEEPPQPSTRLTQSKESMTKLAAQRRTEPARLSRELRGELDWIVMKALEKDRSRRYDTANSLARDVERYLHDEAVEACPPSTTYRLKKFLRKHRAEALTAIALVVVLVLGAVVSAWQAVRATRAELQARDAAEAEVSQRRHAEEQQRRAEANFRLARDAVDQYFTKVSDSRQLKAHGLERLRKDLLGQAKEFYAQLLKEQADDPGLRVDQGKAFLRLASFAAVMGEPDEAIHAAREARTLFQQLAQGRPDSTDYQANLASALDDLGLYYNRKTQTEQAKAVLEEALATFERLAREHESVSDYRRGLANTLVHLSAVYEAGYGQPAKAKGLLERALALRGDLVREQPHVLEYRLDHARAHLRLVRLHESLQDYAQAAAFGERAVLLFEQLVAEDPAYPDYQSNLADGLVALALEYNNLRKPERAKACLEKAQSFLERLAQAHPDMPGYRNQLRFIRVQRPITLALLGAHAQAAAEVEAAIKETVQGLELYNAACAYALCSVAAHRDAKLTSPEQKEIAGRYQDRAVEILQQAEKQEFFKKDAATVEYLRKDKDLDPLRGNEVFKKLLARVEQNRTPN